MAKKRESVLIRVGLTPAEHDAARAISERTGISIARLYADAIRKEVLKVKR